MELTTNIQQARSRIFKRLTKCHSSCLRIKRVVLNFLIKKEITSGTLGTILNRYLNGIEI